MQKIRDVLMNSARCRNWTPAYRIAVRQVSATMVWAIILGGCAVKPETPTPGTSATPQTSVASAKAPTAPVAKAQLQELTVREERGQTTLWIKLVQPITQYRHFPLPQPARVVLDVPIESGSPVTDTFRINTSIVSVLRVSSGEDNLRLTVEIAAATVPPYTVSQEDGGVKIVVGANDMNANAKSNTILVQGGRRMDVGPGQRVQDSPSRTEARAQAPVAEEKPGGEKVYTGQKISLDFKDADIKNVFRLLAEVSGLNLVVTADVNRRITVRLIEVPWDQALDLIISTNGLDREQVGNVVRISTAGALKAEKDALIASRKSKEDLEPLTTTYFNVNYAKAKDLEPKIKVMMSKRQDSALVVDERSNTIMLRDIQKSIEDVNALVTKLDLRTPQVLIESNLIETTPTFSRSLGIELESMFDANTGRIRGSTRFRADPPFEGAPQLTPDANRLIIPTTGFRWGWFGNNITGILSAAEQEGKVKIISRPSVVTLNNVTSTIESANIIRVRTSAATVGEAGNLREIRAGIILKVTPQVSADGLVLLNIEAKSSTLDFGRTVDGIPQENIREAKANVLVRDGETVVIGGILKDNSNESESGIPYLKDIPGFGWIFKKSSWQRNFEELVVFITPRIVAAGSENLPNAEQIWRDQMKKTDGLGPTAASQQSLKP